jgi:hypothetical protein
VEDATLEYEVVRIELEQHQQTFHAAGTDLRVTVRYRARSEVTASHPGLFNVHLAPGPSDIFASGDPDTNVAPDAAL